MAGHGQALPNSPGSLNLAPVFLAIQESEYEIRWQPAVSAYQSPNRANNLRFTYFANGVQVENRTPKNPEELWKINLELISLAGEKLALPTDTSGFAISRNQAQVVSDQILVDYVNTKEGMRQSFVVSRKPAGSPLEIRMRLTLQGLDCFKANQENYVYFVRPDGTEVLRYTDLKAWDSKGTILKAGMELSPDKELSLWIDDAQAQYPVVVDPLYLWADPVNGSQLNSRFGFSVASGGALDPMWHFGSIIVGAPYYDNGQPDEGMVFVYWGDVAALPDSPDWTAESNQAYSHFGKSVASSEAYRWGHPGCLTLNGDIRDDVIIGAPDYSSPGHYYNGSVFIWYQTSQHGTPDNADVRLDGEHDVDSFGFSVASAGDVNGGQIRYVDIIIGAPNYTEPFHSANEGAAYVYQGTSAGLDPNYIWKDWGGYYACQFGFSVAGARDVNNDDYDDIIVGVPGYSQLYDKGGRALVYHGCPGGITYPVTSIVGDQAQAWLGWSVGSAGDANNDGYAEVVVGAPYYTQQYNQEGRASVYFGSINGITLLNPWITRGNQAVGRFGWSVAGGPIDDDDFAEVIVGTPYYDVVDLAGRWHTDGGQVWVFGSPTGLSGGGPTHTPADAIWTMIPLGCATVQDYDHFGYSIGYVYSIFQEEYKGLIVGAPEEDGGGGVNCGGATVWYFYNPYP